MEQRFPTPPCARLHVDASELPTVTDNYNDAKGRHLAFYGTVGLIYERPKTKVSSLMAKPKHNMSPVNPARASAWTALTVNNTTSVALP
jgi:hypothetical protein